MAGRHALAVGDRPRHLVYGVLGIWCGFTADTGFWLATVIAVSIYLLGAAAGHVGEMVTAKNFRPGNAGVVFCVVLYLIAR